MYKLSETCQIKDLDKIYTNYFGLFSNHRTFVEIGALMVNLYQILLVWQILDGEDFMLNQYMKIISSAWIGIKKIM